MMSDGKAQAIAGLILMGFQRAAVHAAADRFTHPELTDRDALWWLPLLSGELRIMGEQSAETTAHDLRSLRMKVCAHGNPRRRRRVICGACWADAKIAAMEAARPLAQVVDLAAVRARRRS